MTHYGMNRPTSVLFISGTVGGGTARYRVRLAQEALQQSNIASKAFYFTDRRAAEYLPGADVLALYRVPDHSWVRELVRRAHRSGIPVTYDIDDLVFRPDHLRNLEFLTTIAPSERAGFEEAVPAREAAIRWSTLTSGTTTAITSELHAITGRPSILIPNGVGRVALAAANQSHRDSNSSHVTLGYLSGSNTHDADWRTIEGDIAQVMHNDRQVRLLLVGDVLTGPELEGVSERIIRRPFCDWRDLFALLCQVDVNLAPLTGNPFTEGKSAIKWLEAALVRTPTIATATEPNAAAIQQGVTGLLVPPGDSWLDVLTQLSASATLRTQIGDEAREAALERFGPDVQSRRYLDYFTTALNTMDNSAAILPAAFRVPYPSRALEPYPFDVEPRGWTPNRFTQARTELMALRSRPRWLMRRMSLRRKRPAR